MDTPASVRADEMPPYEVGCLEVDRSLEADGHRHAMFVDTRDPDGGTTRWSSVQVIAAIEDGEQFVVADDDRGAPTLLEAGTCPACSVPTLVTGPADAEPGPCE